MTMQSVPISSNGRDPTMAVNQEDTSSVATPPIGFRNSSEDDTFLSKTLRFYFPPSDHNRIDRVHPAEIHSQWIRMIQTAYGEDMVKIINNNNRPVKHLTSNPTANSLMSHSQQFKVHTKLMGNSPTTGAPKTVTVIVHRILTRVPLGQLKRHPEAYQLLIDNKCYLNEHLWDEQEWDTQQIGFVTGYNPKYYTSDRVTAKFRARLSKQLPRIKIPKFQMVLKTQRIQHQGRTSTTQAYALELPSYMASQLIPHLKEVTKDSKEFVTFQMRRRNPDAFQGAIRYQNHLLSQQHVIVINSIGTDAMYYLSDRIKAITGVIDVVPERKVDENGKFYAIVDKEQIQYVRDKLKKRFQQWYEDAVPEDARPKPDQYEGPPAIGVPNADAYSEGENTYMTHSTRSFMSFSITSMQSNSNEENTADLDGAWEMRNDRPSPPTVRTQEQTGKTYTSYAAAAASDQVSGITESEPSPRGDARHEELSLKIASLEAMITALCMQVQALTTAQAQQGNSLPPTTPRDPSTQSGKRQDVKSTPRKQKRSHDQTADSDAEEGAKEPVPMDEHPLTVWDDYTKNSPHE